MRTCVTGETAPKFLPESRNSIHDRPLSRQLRRPDTSPADFARSRLLTLQVRSSTAPSRHLSIVLHQAPCTGTKQGAWPRHQRIVGQAVRVYLACLLELEVRRRGSSSAEIDRHMEYRVGVYSAIAQKKVRSTVSLGPPASDRHRPNELRGRSLPSRAPSGDGLSPTVVGCRGRARIRI
jgi:hypothetical protein